MAKNEIITPYFENEVFAGVRVTLGDEDFVIAPKDYQGGKLMNWYDAMEALKSDGLDSFTHQQSRLIMANYEEIEKALRLNGGEYLNMEYWTCTEQSGDTAFYYDGYTNFLRWDIKSERYNARAIKNLKKTNNYEAILK